MHVQYMCCMHVKLIRLYFLLSVYCVVLITVNSVPSQAITINQVCLSLSLSLSLSLGTSFMVTGRMTHMTSILS